MDTEKRPYKKNGKGTGFKLPSSPVPPQTVIVEKEVPRQRPNTGSGFKTVALEEKLESKNQDQPHEQTVFVQEKENDSSVYETRKKTSTSGRKNGDKVVSKLFASRLSLPKYTPTEKYTVEDPYAKPKFEEESAPEFWKILIGIILFLAFLFFLAWIFSVGYNTYFYNEKDKPKKTITNGLGLVLLVVAIGAAFFYGTFMGASMFYVTAEIL